MTIHDEDGNLLGEFPYEMREGARILRFFSEVDWPCGMDLRDIPLPDHRIELASVPLWVCPAEDVEALLVADRFQPAGREPSEVLRDIEAYLWRTCDDPSARPNFPEIARRVVEIARGAPLRPEDGGGIEASAKRR